MSAFARHAGVELTRDRRMTSRVMRLGFVSTVALGMVWFLALAALSVPGVVAWALAGGWVLMPLTLYASLSRPRMRYGLVLPASLVSLGLLAICLGWLPTERVAAAGWVLLTGGVLLGGLMGLWFWYRVAPVPAALDDPYSVGRWLLIALHVALIVVGWGLAATALVSG